MDSPPKNRLPLTRIQELIAERMLQSKLSKPCFYVESKADVTELMALRPKLSKSFGVRITSNAFFIRSVALGAKRYPIVLGHIKQDSIELADAINVGFAVHAPQGLVVPVIKDTDKKTLAEIAQLEKSFTEKARSSKLKLEEMEGQTIGLSNLGAYGIDSFWGIVPPPASAILAAGNVVNMLVPKDDKIIVCKTVNLSLAVDHRIINGLYAAKFLAFITEQLQNPQQLI